MARIRDISVASRYEAEMPDTLAWRTAHGWRSGR